MLLKTIFLTALTAQIQASSHPKRTVKSMSRSNTRPAPVQLLNKNTTNNSTPTNPNNPQQYNQIFFGSN